MLELYGKFLSLVCINVGGDIQTLMIPGLAPKEVSHTTVLEGWCRLGFRVYSKFFFQWGISQA
jgi:hypothetical protein